jgi:hypothetical protein
MSAYPSWFSATSLPTDCITESESENGVIEDLMTWIVCVYALLLCLLVELKHRQHNIVLIEFAYIRSWHILRCSTYTHIHSYVPRVSESIITIYPRSSRNIAGDLLLPASRGATGSPLFYLQCTKPSAKNPHPDTPLLEVLFNKISE